MAGVPGVGGRSLECWSALDAVFMESAVTSVKVTRSYVLRGGSHVQISLTRKGSRVGYPTTRGAGPSVDFSVACEVFQVLGERSLERCTASESSLFLNAQFWNNEIIMGCLKSDFQMSNKLN